MSERWSAGTGALKVTWLVARAAGAVSARLAGRPTARLWFTPWRVPLPEKARAAQQEWLSSTSPISIPFRGGRLSGVAAGDGPAVLLVHGWGESAGALGSYIGPLLDAGYRVVALDLPAHGASPGGQTDAFETAAAVRAAAEELGGVRAVIAHSMGAHAAIVALAEGLEAEGAVLLAPAVRLEHGLDRFGAMFRLPPKAVKGLRTTIERRYGRTVWDDLAADRLAGKISTHALIVHDADDPQVDIADAQLLAEAWQGAQLRTTNGLGHNKLVRDPGVVGAALDFLQSVVGRQRDTSISHAS